jgi:fibrillarin-like rRNA methylase
MLPRIIKSKFNTVIIKNIFNYVDKNIKVSLINRYSIKMTASQIDILQEIIEKLKDEQIKVLFEIE